MKILITGANGQLGRELVGQSQLTGRTVLAPSRCSMDITNLEKLKYFIDLHQPSLLINAAAYTQVDNAETEKSLAFAVNKTGSANLAQVCAENGIPLVQLSTDYVFDGKKKTSYNESDPISPLSVYGQSKAEGEKAIRSLLKEHIILRTSWLYGIYGQNFVKTMLKAARDRKSIRVVSDQYGSPTCAADLAQAILSIADLLHHRTAFDWGTYHYCGRGIVSWHEFAETIVDFARLYGKIKTSRVEPINTGDCPTKARRPVFSALDCTRIKENLGIDPKPWRKSLKTTIQRLFSTDGGHF